MRVLAAGAVAPVAFGILAFSLTPSAPEARSAKCGVERWPVKTLTDPAAAEVDLAHSKTTTVEKLRHLKVPKELKKGSPRIPPVETTVYRVKARLQSMKREEDSDIRSSPIPKSVAA